MLKRRFVCSIFTVSVALVSASAQAFDLGGMINSEQLRNLGQSLPQNQDNAAASSAGLASFSNKDQVTSLKQALTQGAETAVRELAKQNGYLGNDKVRIPLPENLQKIASLMQTVGMGKYADDLITSMNRAAEAAVPEAQKLLVGAVKTMSVDDAKNILTGGNEAATQYFRKKTETALTGKFKPIVEKSMEKVQLARQYDQFAAKGAALGLVDHRDAKMDDYVTRKALDGLFVMMAEQEKAIRANPLEATGALAKQVFSAIRN